MFVYVCVYTRLIIYVRQLRAKAHIRACAGKRMTHAHSYTCTYAHMYKHT